MATFQIIYIGLISYVYCNQCDLAKSCIGVQINDSNYISPIGGYKAAFGATTQYIGSNDFVCHGAYACSSMKSITLQSLGKQSVRCGGSNSCSNTTLRIRELQCFGVNACAASNISYNSDEPQALNCNGYGSCAYAHIYGVGEVRGYAPWSLYR
eukprot:681_1